jgi:hypothetical protein
VAVPRAVAEDPVGRRMELAAAAELGRHRPCHFRSFGVTSVRFGVLRSAAPSSGPPNGAAELRRSVDPSDTRRGLPDGCPGQDAKKPLPRWEAASRRLNCQSVRLRRLSHLHGARARLGNSVHLYFGNGRTRARRGHAIPQHPIARSVPHCLPSIEKGDVLPGRRSDQFIFTSHAQTRQTVAAARPLEFSRILPAVPSAPA